MSQLRNIAVSGITTQEQYNKVITICGSQLSRFNEKPGYPIVYDDGSTGSCFMHNWFDRNYHNCTRYTYEEFITKFDKKETQMLELQEPVVFTTLEELQEAVDLGLQAKDLYLNGEYSLPMLQSIAHGAHIPLDGILNTANVNSMLHITAGQRVLDWKDVRHKYIKPKTKMTLAQIEEALGYKVELI